MALLFCAQKIYKKVLVVHVRHDMRPACESQKDVDLVTNYCRENCLELAILEANLRDAEGLAASEDAYRQARYQQISNFCEQKDFMYAATAHHADDQIETLLMKICRGTGIRGLQGIAESVDKGATTFVRPMLSITKDAVYEICKQNSIPYIEDYTNCDTDIVRNAVRHKILPQLKELYPKCAENAQNLTRIATSAHMLVQAEVCTLANYEERIGKIRVEALALAQDVVVYEWLRYSLLAKHSTFMFDKLNSTVVSSIVDAIRSRNVRAFKLQDGIQIRVNKSFVEIV